MEKITTRLIAIVLGSTIALVLAEISIRSFFPHSRDHIIPGQLFQMDPELGWSFRQGESSRHQTRSFDVEYRINEFGYRDRERALQKTPGTKRVLLYGDSQTFGWGLTIGDRYSDLLEDRIPGLQVWNLAVPAYGLDQELLSFERDGRDFSPDVAIFLVSGATLQRTRHGYNYKKYKPQFVINDSDTLTLLPVPKSGRMATDFLYGAIGWLYLPYFVEIRLETLKSKWSQPEERSAIPDPLQELNKHILLRAKAAVEGSKVKLVILAASLPEPKNRQLEEFCQAHDIVLFQYELVDPAEQWVLSPTDGHYNRRAAEAIANQIEPPLRTLLDIPWELHK